MLMTEAQARTKWCPHSRQIAGSSRDPVVSGTANRDSRNHYGVENCNCIASECMAWRVESYAGEFTMKLVSAKALIERFGDTYEIVSEHDHPLGANATVRRLADIGYCGLAGRVED